MKIARFGIDWIEIDEDSLDDYKSSKNHKYHLIKLKFFEPNEEKINKVINLFEKTNRYIIEDNIKIYNDLLKGKKKYYVENTVKWKLISFLKKNNKCLLNIDRLDDMEFDFFISEYPDILRNVEVIKMSEKTFDRLKKLIEKIKD